MRKQPIPAMICSVCGSGYFTGDNPLVFQPTGESRHQNCAPPQAEDRLNALESELVALRLQAKIGSAVVAAYRHNPVVVAEVCDEVLDQSGALLDWVHAAAKEYPHE